MPAHAKRLQLVTQPHPEPLLTPAQVAEWLGITIDALRMKARRGHIIAIRLDGRNMRFRRVDVEDYLNSRPLV